jgi:hypothetical protein
VRRADPIVIRIKTPRKSRSIPKRLAQLVAKGEKIAKVRRGRLVKRPRELTSTPKLAAISDKTVERVVNGARKTTPSKRIPGMRKREWFCFIMCLLVKMNSIRIIIAQELGGGKRNYRGTKPVK